MRSSTSANDAVDLVLQTQPSVTLKEGPAVMRARRALARRLETQDPRLFVAVLTLAQQIQRETEQQCGSIIKERTEGLSQLLDTTRQLKQLVARQLDDAAASEVKPT